MGLTKPFLAALALAGLVPWAVRAQPSAELLDLAARVHYGFYHGEARTIDAASASLERLGESQEVFYYRDFAALRRAQLGGADRTVLAHLSDCAQRDVAGGTPKARAAEAWVLVAACALVAGDVRRHEDALSYARALDDDNPRISLIEVWALERAPDTDPGRREAVATKLAAVVEAFEAWAPSIDDPDWGHAEALSALAASTLERGQVRQARDLIERALLLAPDYRVAVELRATLQKAQTGNRAL